MGSGAVPPAWSCVPAVRRLALVVAVGVLSSCGLSTWNEFEARDAARGAVYGDDKAQLAELVREHPELSNSDGQRLLLGSTACHPGMAEFMIDDLDFRPDTERDGWGVLNSVLAPETGQDELSNSEDFCSTEVLVETLRILLEAGADPCLSPDDDDASRPLLAAEAWGYSEAVQNELASHGFRC